MVGPNRRNISRNLEADDSPPHLRCNCCCHNTPFHPALLILSDSNHNHVQEPNPSSPPPEASGPQPKQARAKPLPHHHVLCPRVLGFRWPHWQSMQHSRRRPPRLHGRSQAPSKAKQHHQLPSPETVLEAYQASVQEQINGLL
ncbi:hypothetical protein QC764_510050 [Podospora pseudoanserina]|uniref:Uncharacterized protein n=1 Tax=Podospora pseudoanserina TaxID=2609844 RepID=A0ABR0I7V0_9PEZI|nr:hypothetical protein QC764_510050 [Podospora pseudoanserina]